MCSPLGHPYGRPVSAGTVLITGIAGAFVARAQLVAWLAETADRRESPAGSWVEVTGARVHHRRSGKGPAVLFVHGFAGDGRTFDRVAALASSRYDCVVVDRPGHGRSTRSPRLAAGAPTTQAAQLDELMSMLGLDRYLVVCHSWGSYIGLALALLRPRAVTGLVLAGCVAYAAGGRRVGLQPRALTLVPLVGPPLWRCVAVPCTGSFTIAISALFAPEAVDDDFVVASTPSVFLHAGHVRAATQDFVAAAREVPKLAAGYGRIDVPVVLLGGEHDLAAPVSVHAGPLQGVLRQARLRVEAGAGHMLPVTRPEVVVAAIDEVMADGANSEAYGG
jgi:pimeloyl-ACP methyl ester carboxylesterase